MIVGCEQCGARYQDAVRSTVCPHEAFPANDGRNNFRVHHDSPLEYPTRAPFSLPDTGTRDQYSTGAVRETLNVDKGRFDLLPPEALRRLAVHFARGANKYKERNWEKGIPLSRYADSALRHLFAHLGGDRSEDHLAAAAWNVLCHLETEHRVREGRLPAELDDLPPAKAVQS